MPITPPPSDTTNLAHLLSARGWHRNTDIITPDCTVWDFAPSIPEQVSNNQDISPTCLFIYDSDELRCFGVEPATRTTDWNPHSKTFNQLEDLLKCLPTIEHWRAPQTPPTHNSHI